MISVTCSQENFDPLKDLVDRLPDLSIKDTLVFLTFGAQQTLD